ncbi:MAG: tetratricopeptide repeat protein [Chlorobium sp.]|nr:MAG: tetratricopeptide repeat protein [Chlorobium sp.]
MKAEQERAKKEAVLQQDPDNSQRQYELALVCIEEHRNSEALELLDRCIAERRRDPQALYARAVTNIAMGIYRNAACDLLKAIVLEPGSLHAYKHLGFVQFMLGKEEAALKTLHKGLAINPDYTDIYCVLGDIHLDLGDFDKAREAFEKALALEPDKPEPHSKIAMYYLARGDMKGLKKEYDILKTLDAELAGQIGSLFFDTP